MGSSGGGAGGFLSDGNFLWLSSRKQSSCTAAYGISALRIVCDFFVFERISATVLTGNFIKERHSHDLNSPRTARSFRHGNVGFNIPCPANTAGGSPHFEDRR